jgi:multidrug efflux pump subunit AcrA (membrane-fusion protein)
MKKIVFFLVSILIFLFLTVGCGKNKSTPTEIAPLSEVDTVVTEGHFVPRDSLYLSFLIRGQVSEILVKQGDKVTEGQELIRVGDSQQAEAALTAVKLELISAQQAVDTLIRTAGLGGAQAQIAYINAQKARIDSQLVWDRLDLKSIQTSIDNAQEVVDTRKTDLDSAQQDFDENKGKPADDPARINSEDRLKAAQTAYDDAIRLLLIQTNRRDIPKAGLASAVTAESEAGRTYKNTMDGPDKDILALSQARLVNAIAQESAAQNAVDNYVLKAPFAGIVAEINVSINQQVGPEAWAVVVIDPSVWYVDTSDLTEYEVVNIEVGDTAIITVDVLPDVEISGVVEQIAMAPKVQAGDVIYTVRIRVDEPDPQMKWGMTVEIAFPIK